MCMHHKSSLPPVQICPDDRLRRLLWRAEKRSTASATWKATGTTLAGLCVEALVVRRGSLAAAGAGELGEFAEATLDGLQLGLERGQLTWFPSSHGRAESRSATYIARPRNARMNTSAAASSKLSAPRRRAT